MKGRDQAAQRAKARMGQQMHNMLERRFQLPPNAAPRLLEDIQTYSALVELQTKMSTSAPWFQRVN